MTSKKARRKVTTKQPKPESLPLPSSLNQRENWCGVPMLKPDEIAVLRARLGINKPPTPIRSDKLSWAIDGRDRGFLSDAEVVAMLRKELGK